MTIKKQIMLGGNNYLIIDLTQPLRLDTEVYPGDPKLEKIIFSEISKNGYEHHIYKIGDHNFHPHGDAPNHQNPEIQDGFEYFDINYCFNSAFIIDLSNNDDATTKDDIKYLQEVKKEHLEPFADLFTQKGAVIIRTGYDKWIETNNPHSPNLIPYLDEEAARFISTHNNIQVIGIDSLTIDAPKQHTAHQLLKNTLIVECLVHLYEIPSEQFDLQTTPVKIEGATGGPIVAYAFIDQ